MNLSPPTGDRFTPAQLDALRTGFAKIDRIDPCSESYTKLIACLDELPPAALAQLEDGKIRFLAGLARNRLNRPRHFLSIESSRP